MVDYSPDRFKLREEARQLVRDLAAQQATTAAETAEPADEVPDGYFAWDSTPREAINEALAKAGFHLPTRN